MAGQPPSLQYVDFPIFNALIPKEGPKAVPFYFDFAVQSSYAVDLQNQVARSVITMVQTIWIDNSLNTAPVSIRFDVIGQTVKFAPGWQGYFPVLVVNPPKFTVTSVGGVSAHIVLLNVPFPAGSWGTTQQSANFDGAGNMLVSDVLLEAAVSGNHFQSDNFIMSQNDVRIPDLRASQIITGSKIATGSTAVLAAGGAGVNFFISTIDISISGNATSAAATVVVSLMRAAVIIYQWEVALPLVATVGKLQIANLQRESFISSVDNAALNINFSAALTAGSIKYNIGCGYTTTVRP